MDFVDVVGAGQLLAFGSANLIVTVLALRHARRSTELAEHRVEALRAEQARIVAHLREERRAWRRDLGEERAQHASLSEARRREKQANRQQAPADADERPDREPRLAHEAQKPEESSTRLDTERRIARLEAEIRTLRETTERRKVARPVAAGASQAPTGAPQSSPPKPAEPVSRDPYETAAGSAGSTVGRREKPGRVVWHPHPDARAGGAAGAGGEAPVEMFRKHYDKYLDNYEGYVELAEEIQRTRKAGGTPPRSPFGERELQDRLRRLEDGIARTTSRLDLLEQYNPQLATDDRITRRAGIASRHARLDRP